MLARIIFKSLWTRRFSSTLTVTSIAFSVALLLGVERAREGARNSFTQSISDVDLIVGKKGGSLNLLLYTVFRLGSPTENVTYKTFQTIAHRDDITHVIPYSLGDSYRQFRVVGTDERFFEHFRYGKREHLSFSQGKGFSGIFDVVLGADVAQATAHQLNDKIVLSHGDDIGNFQTHEATPFQVKGILKPTGTPADRAVYISLYGMTAMHVGWEDGGPPKAGTVPSLTKESLQIDQVTAFFVKTKSPMATLYLQRDLNEYEDEPLMAILPGVVLSELWQSLNFIEKTLRWISLLVVFVGLVTMLIAIYNTLNERRREIAILRSLGASPPRIFAILVGESMTITCAGVMMGLAFVSGATHLLGPYLKENFGLSEAYLTSSPTEWLYATSVLVIGGLLGFIPALRAYLNSLSDGFSIRS